MNRPTADNIRYRAYARGNPDTGYSVKLMCWSCNTTTRGRNIRAVNGKRACLLHYNEIHLANMCAKAA